jgi:MoaA/NifB/PqqE/SkfB family radical SAM enzyme
MKKVLYLGKYRLGFTTGRNSYFFVKLKIVFRAIYQKKITIKKIFNAIVCNLSFYFKSQKSGKSPIIVSVDLWNECNENCVFCRGGDGKIYDLNPKKKDSYIPKIKLDVKYFKQVVDSFKENLLMIIPYVNGEPLMHKDIYEAIGYANKNRLLTLIASNGILLNDNNSEKLIDSGLDFLKVHISGYSNPVHQIQHRKGNVDLILKNLENFVKKNNNKKSNTLVMLDYILYNHNRHEVNLAREFADKHKILFNVRPGNPKFMEDSEVVQNKADFDFTRACDWPWKALTIDCNRNINPCCEYSVFSNKTPYEKIEDSTDLNKLWTGQNVIYFRKEHAKNGRVNLEVCKKCDRAGLGFKY